MPTHAWGSGVACLGGSPGHAEPASDASERGGISLLLAAAAASGSLVSPSSATEASVLRGHALELDWGRFDHCQRQRRPDLGKPV